VWASLDIKGREKIVEDAQKKLDWAVAKEQFRCKIIGFNFDRHTYKVEFKQEEALITAKEIARDWIDDIDPADSYVRDELKSLFRKIDLEMNPFSW
jgi:hypothetical protein